MPKPAKTDPEIETLDQAKARLAALEQKFDEALRIIVKRDNELDAAQRKIWELEQQLADLTRKK
jgi:hypothetical protein